MKKIGMLGFAVAVAVALAGGPAWAAGDVERGAKVFKKCKACHTIKEGAKHRVGPNLFGMFGRTSGMTEGFRFSKAMKGAAVVWDEKTLDEFLTKPKKFVPKTKMSFPGLKKAQQREDIIAYLKQATM
jgi:cytochrome c